MLRTLLKKQTLELGSRLMGGDSGKKRSKPVVIGFGLLMIYALLAVTFMFYVMADALCAPLTDAGLGWMYFAIMGVLALIMGIVGSIFVAYAGIYRAKDNELLLSMPIEPYKLLMARIISIYAMSLIMVVVVMAPTLAVYAQTLAPSFASIFGGISVTLLVSLLATAFSCVLGWVVAIISAHLAGAVKTIISLVTTLGFLAGYYYLYSKAYAYLQLLLINGQEIGQSMKKWAYPIYQMGKASDGDLLALAVFAVISIAIFAAVYGVLSRSFLKLATTNKGAVKAKYKENNMVASSASGALFRKELARFTSSTIYMLNCGIGAVLMIIGAGALLVKAEMVKGAILPLSQQFFNAPGGIALMGAGIVALMSSMIMTTAPSVSLEGKSIWIAQSLPVKAWDVLKAKVNLQLTLSIVPSLAFAICFGIVLDMTLGESLLMAGAIVAFNIMYALAGLVINLKMPNLNWTNEVVPVKQSMAVLVTLLGSWAAVVSLGGSYWLLSKIITPYVYMICVIMVLTIVALALLGWLRNRGAVIFQFL